MTKTPVNPLSYHCEGGGMGVVSHRDGPPVPADIGLLDIETQVVLGSVEQTEQKGRLENFPTKHVHSTETMDVASLSTEEHAVKGWDHCQRN